MDKERELLSDVLAQYLANEDDEAVAKVLSRLDAALPAALKSASQGTSTIDSLVLTPPCGRRFAVR